MRALRLSIAIPERSDAVFPVMPTGSRIRLGRSAACEVRIPHPSVAPCHGEFLAPPAAGGSWTFQAAVEGPGAWVHGRRLRPGERVTIDDGVELGVGRCLVTFRLLAERALEGSSPGLAADDFHERLGEVQASPRLPAPGSVDWALVVVNGPQRGRVVSLGPGTGRVVVGRSRRCDVTLVDPRISRRHAFLGMRGGRLWLRDAGGVGGVVVNGRRCRHRAQLAMGDLVDLGGTRLEVRQVGGGRGGSAPGGRAGSAGPTWEIVDPVGLALGVFGIAVGVAGAGWFF